MKKDFLKQLTKGELSPTDTLFYTGVINANSGLIKLAAAVEKEHQQEKQAQNPHERER